MATIHPEHSSIFSAHLHGDEKLVWAGSSSSGATDSRFTLYLAFLVVWLCLLLLMVGFGHIPAGFSILPNPIGVLFIVMPLAMISFGIALCVVAWRNMTAPRHQVYAVTSRRLMWFDRRKTTRLQTRMISQLSGVQRNGEGRGTLIFQNSEAGFVAIYMKPFSSPSPDRFIDIADPKRVEAIILEQMFKKETP